MAVNFDEPRDGFGVRDHFLRRDAEIQQLHCSAGGNFDVRRLQIPMHDPALVGRVQGFCNLAGDRERLFDTQSSQRPDPANCRSSGRRLARRGGRRRLMRGTGQQLGQRRPLHQLKHQRAAAAAVLYAVDGSDVRMVERRQHAGCAIEAGALIRVCHQPGGQDFNGHVAVQFGVPGTVHFPHAAGADGGGDFVITEPSARGQRHSDFFHDAENCRT